MRSILSEDVPCWYELSWRPPSEDPPALILRVHRDFVRAHPVISGEAPVIRAFQGDFKLGPMQASLEGDFGFDPAPFRRLGEREDGFVEFRVDMPAVNRPTGRACPECKGKGRQRGSTCFYCDGTKVEKRMSWLPAQATVASLATFFMWGRSFGIQGEATSAAEPQLMEIWSGLQRNSAPLGGAWSLAFMRWLGKFPQYTEFPAAAEAIWAAYAFMFDEKREKLLRSDVRAWLIHPCYLSLDCPGQACGIFPSHHGNRPDRGVEFTDHNLDSPAQQLALLAGLAAIHDQARRETRTSAVPAA